MTAPPPIVRLLVNCPDLAAARRIAEALLDERLAASANIHPRIESHYVWKGVRERAAEVPLALKTTAALAPAAMERIAALHPYEVPAIVAQPLEHVHPPYARWVAEMTAR